MKNSKRCLAMFVAALLVLPTFTLPAKAAETWDPLALQNSLYDISQQVNAVLSKLSDRPFASELFTHFLCGKGDKVYWEENVPQHIKDEIFAEQQFQEKLEYVLKKAYSAGSWKVVYTFDEETPAYFDSSLLNEHFVVDSMGFSGNDMAAAIGHINGRLVIGADYLGDDKFEVWTSLSDLYDFTYQECGSGADTLCELNNVGAFLQEFHLGHTFNVTMGFTRLHEWTPPTDPKAPDLAAAPVNQPQHPHPPYRPGAISGEYP